MKITAYAHASKESLIELGNTAGLSPKALDLFKFALGEVECELEVDFHSGAAKIVAVNGKKLSAPAEA